jgi:hypothetical protein
MGCASGGVLLVVDGWRAAIAGRGRGVRPIVRASPTVREPPHSPIHLLTDLHPPPPKKTQKQAQAQAHTHAKKEKAAGTDRLLRPWSISSFFSIPNHETPFMWKGCPLRRMPPFGLDVQDSVLLSRHYQSDT